MQESLESFFQIRESGSSISQEFRAGITIFLAMSYILFVNPMILASAFPGVAASELMAGTALAAAIGCLVMGLWARYPFAMAPGMGLNAYFSFTLVGSQGVELGVALGCVFLSGVAFLLISLTGLRSKIISAIPKSIKLATAGGIGLFIAFIGLKTGGVIVAHPATFVSLGDLHSPSVILTIVGVVVSAAMMARGIKGAILIGMIAVTICALVFGLEVYPGGRAFGGLNGDGFGLPRLPLATIGQLDIVGALSTAYIVPIVTLLFVDFFDTSGSLFGLGHQAGFLDRDGNLPRAKQAFTADGIATTISAIIGTSPTTTYIESAAGVSEGARTGLSAVVVGVMFLAALCMTGIVSAVPACATAPALVIVGAAMMRSIVEINWQDLIESIPAFLVILLMPLSFSISHGISFGIVAYVILAAINLQKAKLSPLLIVLAGLIAARYLLIPIE